MPAHKLVLLPADPDTGIDDCTDLVAPLQSIGLIGEALSCNDTVFYPTGRQFLQLISFLGCSPSIELEPPADERELAAALSDGRFCHVIPACERQPRLRADSQVRPPGCPHCGHAVADWNAVIQQWQHESEVTGWHCNSCRQSGTPLDWKFRKNAGFGRVFVDIVGIYPSEAVPCQALLKALQSLTGDQWQYIYIKE